MHARTGIDSRLEDTSAACRDDEVPSEKHLAIDSVLRFALHHAKIFHDVADASDVSLDVGFMAGAQIPGFAGDRRYTDLA